MTGQNGVDDFTNARAFANAQPQCNHFRYETIWSVSKNLKNNVVLSSIAVEHTNVIRFRLVTVVCTTTEQGCCSGKVFT